MCRPCWYRKTQPQTERPQNAEDVNWYRFDSREKQSKHLFGTGLFFALGLVSGVSVETQRTRVGLRRHHIWWRLMENAAKVTNPTGNSVEIKFVDKFDAKRRNDRDHVRPVFTARACAASLVFVHNIWSGLPDCAPFSPQALIFDHKCLLMNPLSQLDIEYCNHIEYTMHINNQTKINDFFY